MEQLGKKQAKNEPENKNIWILYVILLVGFLILLSVLFFMLDKNRPKQTHIATYNFSLGVWPEDCLGTASINKKEDIWALQFDEINQNFLTQPINEYNKIKIKISYSGFFAIGNSSLFNEADVFTIDALSEQNQVLKSYAFSDISIDEDTTVIIEQMQMYRLRLTLTNYLDVDGLNLIASNVLISKIELDSII